MHYHGTPITGGGDDGGPSNQVLIEQMAGAHFCVSFAAPSQVKLCHDIGQSVMLDNGAFSVWRRGLQADWDAYYKWCDRWLDYPTTWAVIPDVIEGDEHDNDLLTRAWPFRDRGSPVWHMHEKLFRLESLLEAFPRVCIGSSGAFATLLTDAWQRRMDEAWRAINARFRRTPHVHMLRGLQLIGHRWPFASVDSTDIARNHNTRKRSAGTMRSRWDAGQCPPRFIDPGEQLEIAA